MDISWRAEYFNDITVSAPAQDRLLQLRNGLAALVLANHRSKTGNRLLQFAEGPCVLEVAPPLLGGVGTKSHIAIFSADLLWHY